MPPPSPPPPDADAVAVLRALDAPGLEPDVELGALARVTARVQGLAVPPDLPQALARQVESLQALLLADLAEVAAHATQRRDAARWAADGMAVQDLFEQAMNEERQRLANFLEGTGAGTWEWHVPSGALVVNPRWAEIVGTTPDELEAASYADWIASAHPEDQARVAAQLQQHLDGRAELYECEFRMRHGDGHWVWVLARGRVLSRDERGLPEWVAGTHLDVTELRRLNGALAEQHELMRVTLQSIGDAVITCNAFGGIDWLNPVAERMTGWTADEARGRPLAEVFRTVHEGSRKPAPDPVAACLGAVAADGAAPAAAGTPGDDGPRLAAQPLLIARDGREHGIEASSAPIRTERGEVLGAVLVFRDVTEQRRLSGEMRWRATHDSLTGLVNRSELELRLTRMLDKAQGEGSAHAMLFLDLDQFKLVNDSCGHGAGDELLRQVARMLGEVVRSRDTLARLGGDEFAVLLEHCAVPQAQRVAQQLCDRMDQYRYLHGGQRFRIGVSIGLVPVDRRWHNTLQIMQAADNACYAAKEAGRNRVHVWFDSDAAVRERHGEMRWATRLEQAMDEDLFELHAQRIDDIDAPQAPLYAEVLLRLNDGSGELVLPGAFLPAAERYHLATRIDRWVLRQVLARMAAAPALDALGCLCVNLSGQSVSDRAMHRHIIELLDGAGPQVCARLCLEITETSAVTNLDDAARFIAEVREAGVRVALDDFGAGASSFNYLKRLQVDVLKIDGQFIRQLTDDSLEAAAVRCFVDVARLVGLRTVAESVENEAVLERLGRLGVDMAQGFLLHRPQPLDDLLAATPR